MVAHIVPDQVAPPIIDLPPIIPVIAVGLVPIADPSPIAASGCDLTDIVQAALRADDAARTELVRLPAAARSVANAVMLWDGRWVATAPARDAALARVRAVVLNTVRNATADCRSQLQAGPRLIAIPGPPDTVLAIGSGRWHWDDLTAGQETMIADNNDRIDARGSASAARDITIASAR